MIHRRITALFGRNEYGENWLQRNDRCLEIGILIVMGLESLFMLALVVLVTFGK
jgi:hypothetical protein